MSCVVGIVEMCISFRSNNLIEKSNATININHIVIPFKIVHDVTFD